MKKRLLIILLIVAMLLASVPAYAAMGKVTTRNITNLYDAYNSTRKVWNELKTAKHRLNGDFVVYCLQHKKQVPNSQTYNLNNLMDNYSAKAKKGLQIILENGYPWERGGLSAAQAEYATANAVRFWLSECGDSQFYNQTNLKDFSNAQLRNLAANGTITKKIRVRSASYTPALQFSVELLIKARAQTVMNHDVTLSASNVSATRSGSNFVGNTPVTVTNLRGGYTLDKSALPSGSTVSGFTGGSGDTLVISIPASMSTANKTYTLTIRGLDDRALGNMQVFNHNSNTNYQRVLAVRAGTSWYEEVVTRTLTVTTGSYVTAQPDLIVSALMPGQSSYTTGNTVSATATIQNQGSAAASGFYVSLYNGSNTQTNYVSGLGVSASTNVSFIFTAPSAAQTLTLTATADSSNHVAECNESNNTRTTTVTISAPAQYPDLIVSALSPGSASYLTGSTISVSATVYNQGSIAARGFYVSLYNGSSTQTSYVSGLGVGASTTVSFSFTAPSTAQMLTLTATADYYNHVAESNENNNTGTGSVTIIGERPDLTVTALTADAGSYKPDERVTITATVKNNGIVSCPASKLCLTGDGITAQTKSVSAISAGGTQTVTFSFAAPYVIRNKTYAITAATDPDNLITESNESNNSRSGRFMVSNPLPDLTVTQIHASKDEYKEDEVGTVTVTVKNQCTLNINNSKLKLTLGDFFSEVKQTGAIAVGGTVQVTFTFTAPETLARLTVTATATADPTNEISESNELNNTLTSTLAVKPVLPDLAITATNAANWYAGKDIVVTATVVNYTKRDVPAVTVRLTLGGKRYEEAIPLPGNGTNLAVFRVTLPMAPGATMLSFVADPYNAIPEQDNDNNDLDKTIEIVSVPIGAVLDPDLTALEENFKASGLFPLPDTSNSDYHIWQEVRLEGESYVTKTFWAQLRTAFALSPDPRIAYEDYPTRMESGFGVQVSLQTVLTGNYDHPEKLVGVQMAWTFAPESGYGQISEWSVAFDALEAYAGSPGGTNVIWQYEMNPWSETGSRLHYTPLWFPDGQYTILSQAFYAWSPAGQLYWYDAESVDILGDMYDRVTAIQGR
ncbi:MAG: CARDB domain-containing protein [Clostridia bacterium]